MKCEVKSAVYKTLDSWSTPRKITGGELECVDGKRSIYHFRPGFRLGDAILSGRE